MIINLGRKIITDEKQAWRRVWLMEDWWSDVTSALDETLSAVGEDENIILNPPSHAIGAALAMAAVYMRLGRWPKLAHLDKSGQLIGTITVGGPTDGEGDN